MTDITQPPAPTTPPVTPPAAAPAPVPVVTLTLPEPPAPAAPLVADQAGKVFTYERTGDTGLDYALNYVGRLGFGPDHPAVVDATKGNFGILKAELAALGDKAPGYTDVIALAEEALTKSNTKKAADAKAIGDYAVKAADTAERWAAVQKWASVNADPDEKKQINAALAAGGVQAKAAVDYLVKCYDKSAGTTKSPKAAVKADATPTSGSTVGPLTASEYSAEVQKLMRANGMRDIGDKPEYAALQARRHQGRKLEGKQL